MTFTKEQISQAFIQVLNERVPDLSHVPDHVFSARFEEKMNKLIRKEAAHPWAVSHTLARNLIAAAIVTTLLVILCMSVGAIRDAVFHFFLQHFGDHDKIIFEMPEKTEIEQKYVITNLPEGFVLKKEEADELNAVIDYGNERGDYIHFSQFVSMSNGLGKDNERSENISMEIDGRGVLISTAEGHISLVWDQDGYVFLLVLHWKNVTADDAVTIFRSIQPAA